MNTTYVFSMRGENLMIAENTDGRKSWEPVARIYRDEGKSVDSNRSRKGWSFECLADSVSRGVYKSKGDAKDNAMQYCLALLEGAGEVEEAPVEKSQDSGALNKVLSPKPLSVPNDPPTKTRRVVPKLTPVEAPVSFMTILRPADTKKEDSWIVRSIKREAWTGTDSTWLVTASCEASGGYEQRPLGGWEYLGVDGKWYRFGE
jgi:hypothetical protein